MHEVTQDVFFNEPSRMSIRLTIRIKLNHDRVLSHSIDSCLDDIHHSSYTLHDCLSTGDETPLEVYVTRYIDGINGRSTTESVTIKSVENIPRP
ncbi:hypothetical protein N9N28_15010 [Rubripirellula amarantea]|nr:hypothetical protein [Rubripirellula amarantea]